MEKLQREIMDLLPNQNDYIMGFADMGRLLENHYPFRYAIAVGAKLDDAIIDGIKNAPTMEYFDLYNKTNRNLNNLVINISEFLKSKGIESQYVHSTVEDSELDREYLKNIRYKYSHRMAATRAGLGWIGNTDLLISKKFGPRLRLASVLTNYRFENLGTPITESRCGTCRICVEECPAQAANGLRWNTQVDRDDFFDAHKCRDMCHKRAWEHIQINISLCGVCVAVCPKGIKKQPKVWGAKQTG